MSDQGSGVATSRRTVDHDFARYTVSSAPGFWEIARAEPGRAAIVDAGGNATSDGDLLSTANRLSHGLRALGPRSSDAVAVVLPNETWYLAIYLAVRQVGLYLVPINWHLTAGEIAYILRGSEPRVLIAGPAYGDAARRAADEADLPPDGRFGAAGFPGFAAIDDLTAGQPGTEPAERRAGQIMGYTCGTTGRPKGVRRPWPIGRRRRVSVRRSVTSPAR